MSTATIPEPVLVDVGGRRVAVADHGPTDGAPVFLFHASPGARVVSPRTQRAAAAHGLRLLAPDRPGFGRSDPDTPRRMSGWAADVGRIADTMGLDRFAMAGASGGGAHAIGTAAALGDRITVAVGLSAMPPVDPQGPPSSMHARNRWSIRLARRSPGAFGFVNRVVAGGAARAIRDDAKANRLLDRMVARLPDTERAHVQDEEGRAVLLASLREAFAQGVDGHTAETVMLSGTWDVDPTTIAAPLHLWHGRDDDLVPLEMVRAFVRDVPAAELHDVPGGHAAWLEHLDDVMATLADPTSAT